MGRPSSGSSRLKRDRSNTVWPASSSGGTAAGEFLLGIALGFLPCGFLYAALAAAAASGQPALGAGAMVAFGLGTAPSLVVVGIAGHAAGRRFQRGVALAGPVLMALNATLLLALAWQRVV